jgi:hypothetical protein
MVMWVDLLLAYLCEEPGGLIALHTMTMPLPSKEQQGPAARTWLAAAPCEASLTHVCLATCEVELPT